jgi:hypothetical protein
MQPTAHDPNAIPDDAATTDTTAPANHTDPRNWTPPSRRVADAVNRHVRLCPVVDYIVRTSTIG